MKKTSLLSLMLCLCLLIAAGCQQNVPPETTIPTTAPVETIPPETTVPPDPAEDYAKAFDVLGSDAVKMSVHMNQTVTVAGQKFSSDSDTYIDYWNIGKENFTARVRDNVDMIQHMFKVDEVYGNGNVYQTIGEGLYTSEMSAEDFLSRYPSLQLLDPTLYTLSYDAEGIRFSDATAVESWLAGEDAEVLSAEGYVRLSSDGSPVSIDYNVEYTHGPGLFSVSCTVDYAPSTQQPEIPADAAEYKTLTDIDGTYMMDIAYGYLLQAKQYSSSTLSSIQSQAVGFMMNSQQSVDTYVTDKGTDYRFESSTYAMDSTGTFEQDVSEKFIDGKYSYAVDGGEYTANSAVSASIIQSAAQDILIANILSEDIFTEAEITNLGSLLFIEYQCDEEMAVSIQQNIYSTYFANATLLDDLSTGYTTNKMELYLALDIYTMLPTSVGYLYEGAHVIDGDSYLTVDQLDQSFDLASLQSYETIYEETAPDAEPEVKPTPLFYKVTGDNGQQMWLFGTIHVGDNRTAYLPSQITDALIASDALAVECDTEGFEKQLEEDEKLQQKVSEAYYYSDGTVVDHLDTEDLYEDARKVLRATGSYFYNSEYLKASLWSNDISNYYLRQGRQLLSDKGVESRLEKIAEENDVPLWEVESSLFQVQMMTGYSDYLQEFLLYSAVYSHGAEDWEGTKELYELWCAGDEAALIEELARESWEITEEDIAEMEAQEDLEEEDLEEIAYIKENLDSINTELAKIYEEYTNAMEISRNAGMLKVAKEYLESGKTIFYAVGLAHLLAEDGLVNTLRDAGYTVELVTYN